MKDILQEHKGEEGGVRWGGKPEEANEEQHVKNTPFSQRAEWEKVRSEHRRFSCSCVSLCVYGLECK